MATTPAPPLMPHLIDDHDQNADKVYGQTVVENLDLHDRLHANGDDHR